MHAYKKLFSLSGVFWLQNAVKGIESLVGLNTTEFDLELVVYVIVYKRAHAMMTEIVFMSLQRTLVLSAAIYW